MNFQPGQKVVFLHEEGGGIVESVEGTLVSVIDEDGFSRKYRSKELAPVYGSDHSLDHVEIEEEKKSAPRHVSKTAENWQIDLHIEELVDSHSGMTNHEILQKQLFELRKFVNEARGRKVRKLVIIHGVGEGVLKEAVKAYFAEIRGVETYDASFRTYGQGATIAELRYKY